MRYCFTTTKQNVESFLQKYYKGFNISITVEGEESCIILHDRSKTKQHEFQKINTNLGEIEGFSEPFFVPNWSTISHKGPYLSQYTKKPFLNSILFHNNNKKQIQLTPQEEEFGFLYIDAGQLNLIDSVFKQNFWNNFKQVSNHYLSADTADYTETNTGKETEMSKFNIFNTIRDVDWRNVKQNYEKYKTNITKIRDANTPDRLSYGFVTIDGGRYSTFPFVADDNLLVSKGRDRGSIRYAITPQDISLNLSPNEAKKLNNKNEFKEILYKPGMRWAAKWKNPLTKKNKYMEIYFIAPNISTDSSVESEIDLKNIASDDKYVKTRTDTRSTESERELSINADSGDSSNVTDSDSSDIGVPDDMVSDELYYSDSDSETLHKFNTRLINLGLDPRPNAANDLYDGSEEFNIKYENNILPLIYFIPEYDQWVIINRVCQSSFSDVVNLIKVSDNIITLIADIITYTKLYINQDDEIDDVDNENVDEDSEIQLNMPHIADSRSIQNLSLLQQAFLNYAQQRGI